MIQEKKYVSDVPYLSGGKKTVCQWAKESGKETGSVFIYFGDSAGKKHVDGSNEIKRISCVKGIGSFRCEWHEQRLMHVNVR